MIACSKCGSTELRVHGSRVQVSYERRWGWFGPVVPRTRITGLDCSCAVCLYAFIARPTGITEAPLQTAHDQLRRLKSGLNNAVGATDGQPAHPAPEERTVPLPVSPRPRGDPRVRRR